MGMANRGRGELEEQPSNAVLQTLAAAGCLPDWLQVNRVEKKVK